MTWNLFIDDERNPEDVTWAPWHIREKCRNEPWVVCRNYTDAIAEVLNRVSLHLSVLITILAITRKLATTSQKLLWKLISNPATILIDLDISLQTILIFTYIPKTLSVRQTSKVC